MNWVFRIMLVFIACGDSLIAAPADSLTNELPRLQSVYVTAVAAIDVKYQTLLTNAPKQYLQGLDTLEQGYQQKGEFKSVMAVRAERERVRPEAFAPGPDSDTDPKELKEYRAKARAIPTQYSEQKAKELETLACAYFTRLEALQRDLTKAGRIIMAAEVQVEMDGIKPALKSLRVKADASVPAAQHDVEMPTGSRPLPTPASLGTSKRITEDGLVALLDKSRNKIGAKSLARVISSDLTLSGKYYASNGIIVEKTAILTLDAGTIIVIPVGGQIRVEGNMRIRGTPGKWVIICGEEKGASRWNGILFVSVEGVNYKPLVVNGLIVADANIGLNIDPGFPYQARQYEFSDCIYYGNSLGMKAGAYGSGQQPSGWIKNSLFLCNTKTGLFTDRFVFLVKTPRADLCTFAKNGVGLECAGGSGFGSQVMLADSCLFVDNGIGVKGVSAQGSIRNCIFDKNVSHLQLPGDRAVADATGNYWGEDTTRLLNASEGANSGQTISRSVNIQGWLKKPPTTSVGTDIADFRVQK